MLREKVSVQGSEEAEQSVEWSLMIAGVKRRMRWMANAMEEAKVSLDACAMNGACREAARAIEAAGKMTVVGYAAVASDERVQPVERVTAAALDEAADLDASNGLRHDGGGGAAHSTVEVDHSRIVARRLNSDIEGHPCCRKRCWH